MRGSGFIGILGFITGILFIALGVVFLVGGPLITDPLDSMLQGSARGLRTSGEAINSVTVGVSNSAGMIDEVKNSLETTSAALSGTGDVLQQTVGILEETREILPAIATDMASMPLMIRNLMPNNHFDEVAERTENVSIQLGLLNTELENLSGDVNLTSVAIEDVAASVEVLQEDLLSAEGSFSEAAEKMESTADFIENGSFTKGVVALCVGIGLLLIITGLYQICSGLMIRRLIRKQDAL